MKTLMIVLVMLPVAALATVDPDPDQIGIYFDLEAETTCIDLLANDSIDAHVIITNPTSEVRGFVFKICHDTPPGSEASVFRGSANRPLECPPPVDTILRDSCLDGHVGTCSPVPSGPGGVVVMIHPYLVLFGVGPVNLYLDDAAYLGSDGEWIPLGVSSGSPDLPVAQINGDCQVVPVEGATFGRVKGLYR